MLYAQMSIYGMPKLVKGVRSRILPNKLARLKQLRPGALTALAGAEGLEDEREVAGVDAAVPWEESPLESASDSHRCPPHQPS